MRPSWTFITMKRKNIDFGGGVVAEGNVFLAPLAGYTDFAFRGICAEFGASVTYTEMVSCKGLLYGSENTKALLYTHPSEKIKAVQIFGEDRDVMRAACESEALAPFDVIDVNMGCPVPKLYKNGEGCALLNDLKKAEGILSACVKSGKNITVKTRIGLKKGEYVTAEFARMAESAGVKLLTVHGRVREDYYAGEPNYEEIAAAKNAVRIPVIANGGIFTAGDADRMMERTGADGVMIARGALDRPWIFAELAGKAVSIDLKALICRHLDTLREKFEDRSVAVNFRKMIPHYLKSFHGVKPLKQRFFYAESTEEIKNLLDELFSSHSEPFFNRI